MEMDFYKLGYTIALVVAILLIYPLHRLGLSWGLSLTPAIILGSIPILAMIGMLVFMALTSFTTD